MKSNSADVGGDAAAVFFQAVAVAVVITIVGLFGALQMDSSFGLFVVAWGWFIAGPFCLVLFVLAVMLITKGAVWRALVVLLVLLPAVPLAVVGAPVWRINEMVQRGREKALRREALRIAAADKVASDLARQVAMIKVA
jgi:hypothetical protein